MAGRLDASEGKTRILIVAGDRLPVDRLVRRLREEGGHAVEVAATLAEAIERIGNSPPDLVLLGPSPTGASFERALAALSEVPSAPAVVVVGGPKNLGVATWALQVGASGYLTEAELGGGRLLMTVEEILAHRRRWNRLSEENQRISDRIDSIERLFEVVSEAELSGPEQIEGILRLGCRLFQQQIGIVSSISGSRYKVLYVEAPEELGLEAGQEFDLGLTYCSITLAGTEPVMIDYMAQSEWKNHPCYHEQGLESYIGARIEIGENEAGTLNFSSPRPRQAEFRGADRDLMVMMSTWVSTILVRQRLDAALRESEALYRDLVENSSDLICTHDLEGNILSANRTLVEMFGRDEDGVTGHNLAEFLSPAVRGDLGGYLEMVRSRGRVRGYMRVLDRDGAEHILEYHNSVRREGVEEPVVRATARDVTNLKRAEAELRHSEQMLRVFVKHTPAALAMFDREMRYLAVSDRWRVDYRLGGADLLGRSHYEVFPEIAEHWKEVHRRCLEGGVEQADEDPFPRLDGTLDWVRWEVRPWYTTREEIGGLLMFTELITDRKRVEDALRYLATHDHLTGLPNRAAFLERLGRSLQRAAKGSPDYGFALFFLDLDDFKGVNDAWGHSTGDELLKRVAERLRRQLRPKDALARFAGDEFVGLLEDTDTPAEAGAAAERLLERLREPFELEGPKVRIEASVGLVLSDQTESADEMIGWADTAMYAAKQAGKGGWHLYENGGGRRDESVEEGLEAIP